MPKQGDEDRCPVCDGNMVFDQNIGMWVCQVCAIKLPPVEDED